ncbi:hypothetical protein KUL17_33470 [Alteromonas sp. KUL17]|uniref:hypothetical protein n=1 Tax=Alteromonas sp. KUL17 TaxID=2480796 RepID=UPI00103815F2|nr:hypothetical protein [Alteromonas sp. KUL17]TAP22479.1 hypothetical protein KUL49_16700 [Alteromonas sp. KUL17]GEA04450.1 hypothetical protein KUL17_33470 [Alteromonas sp. KUL17]
MDKQKLNKATFWFLVGINFISLFLDIVTTNGASILEQSEFQNILLLAILYKLSNKLNEKWLM